MAAELEKLVRDLQDRGHNIGGKLLSDFSDSLFNLDLIPASLENAQPRTTRIIYKASLGEAPEEIERREFIKRLEEEGVSTRCVNILARLMRSKEYCDDFPDFLLPENFPKATDKEILSLPKIGPKGLAEIRKVFPQPLQNKL